MEVGSRLNLTTGQRSELSYLIKELSPDLDGLCFSSNLTGFVPFSLTLPIVHRDVLREYLLVT